MGAVEILDDNIWNLVLFQFHDEFALGLLVAGIVISFILSFAVGAMIPPIPGEPQSVREQFH